MGLFRKSKPNTAVEVEQQLDAVKNASRQSVGANEQLTTTIKNNGFTVIIAATMGAQRHIEIGGGNGH